MEEIIIVLGVYLLGVLIGLIIAAYQNRMSEKVTPYIAMSSWIFVLVELVTSKYVVKFTDILLMFMIYPFKLFYLVSLKLLTIKV